jgi:hypothetical protein
MGDLVLGAAAAVTASTLFSLGLVLQALDTRVTGDGALRLSLFLRLLRRPRWVIGGALMVVGFGFHVGALTLAPLTVVQPALAAGLLVLLAVGARSDAGRVGLGELGAVAAIALGVVGLTLTAPTRTTVSSDALALALALGGLAAIALLPLVLTHAVGAPRRGTSSLMPALGAGAAYALSGLTTKLVSDRLDAGAPLATAFWLTVTVLVALLAVIDQTAALQRGGTTQVGVIVYVVPVIVPVLGAPLLFGESWASSPVGGLPLALSVLAVCVGAGALAASQRVQAAEAAAATA